MGFETKFSIKLHTALVKSLVTLVWVHSTCFVLANHVDNQIHGIGKEIKEVNWNHTLTLTCKRIEHVSSVSCIYQWAFHRRNGKSEDVVLSTTVNNSFTIFNVLPEDEGTYRVYHVCDKVIFHTNCSWEVFLYKKLKFLARSPTKILVWRQRLTLRCEVTGFPHPVINWYKDRKIHLKNKNKITEQKDLKTLTFSSFLHVRAWTLADEAHYCCVAANAKENITTSVDLRVGERPTLTRMPRKIVLRGGDKFVLNCPATGYPTPEIIWKHPKDVPFNRVGANLTARHATAAHSSNYTCMATNIHGAIIGTDTEVIVKGLQFLKPLHSEYFVMLGQHLELNCQVINSDQMNSHGIELFYYQMPGNRRLQGDTCSSYIGNSTMPQNVSCHILNDEGLSMYNLQFSDEGVYLCIAHQGSSTVTMDTRLDVQEKPSFVIRPPAAVRAAAGSDLRFRCSVKGDPRPKVRWEHNNKPLTSTTQKIRVNMDHSLTIKHVSTKEAGVYKCIAWNDIGQVEHSMILIVRSSWYRRTTDARPWIVILVGFFILTFTSMIAIGVVRHFRSERLANVFHHINLRVREDSEISDVGANMDDSARRQQVLAFNNPTFQQDSLNQTSNNNNGVSEDNTDTQDLLRAMN